MANKKVPFVLNGVSLPSPLTASTGGHFNVAVSRLTPERVIEANSNGIFPYYPLPADSCHAGSLLWNWCAYDPRMILEPKDFHISHSLGNTIRNKRFEVRVDTCYEEVINCCAYTERKGEVKEWGWLTEPMMNVYVDLYRQGFNHSIETFLDGELVGGVIGLAIGSAFFGDSQFHTPRRGTDASKVALAHLVGMYEGLPGALIDCRQANDHMRRMGAHDIPIEQFLERLEEAKNGENPWMKSKIS